MPLLDAPAVTCPALLIAGIASGQGKTTVTAALARYHTRQGRRVRVFKIGPDFLDPMLLQAASGTPVENLDLWMVGMARSRALLYRAACESDLILIEGAMGLYDGDPSAADLARAFEVPIAAVIDAGAMAQTFGALALGLKQYQQIPFAGVIANRVASAGHATMLKQSLHAEIPLLACIGRTDTPLPERHLGLVQASELNDLHARLDALANLIEASGLTALPPGVTFAPQAEAAPPRLLEGRVIAVARDDAFSFLYPANLATLEGMGATLSFFSPLADASVPPADALWLPGGYPELHAERLAGNAQWQASVRAFHAAGKPILAECGGMMALTESLETVGGQGFPMIGLLPGKVTMQKRLAAIGMQEVALPPPDGAAATVATVSTDAREVAGSTLRGHTFHYSRFETPLQPVARTTRAKPGAGGAGGAGEAVYRIGNLTASYFHAYFASNVYAVAKIFSPRT